MRCLLKNKPCTYQKKFDWLILPLFKTSLTDSLWHLRSKSIQRVNFPHLNGVHIFFCLAWYNFFFIWISKYNFFFLRKSEYNFFFLKKPGPPPGYEMGGPLHAVVSNRWYFYLVQHICDKVWTTNWNHDQLSAHTVCVWLYGNVLPYSLVHVLDLVLNVAKYWIRLICWCPALLPLSTLESDEGTSESVS